MLCFDKHNCKSNIISVCLFSNYLYLFTFTDWNKESITEPRPTMEISNDDLLDIAAGKQKLEDFISKIICHSVKNEFAVGKEHFLEI